MQTELIEIDNNGFPCLMKFSEDIVLVRESQEEGEKKFYGITVVVTQYEHRIGMQWSTQDIKYYERLPKGTKVVLIN